MPTGPSKPRAVHVCQGLAVGGLERVALDLAQHARKHGHDDRILLFDADHIDLERDLDPADVPVLFAPRRRGLDPGCVLRIARILRAIGPQVLHAHNDTALVYCAAARRLLRAARRPRLVVTFHNRPAHASTGARVATRLACRTADVIVAVSRDLASRLVADRWVTRIGVVPNGIDVARFAPAGLPRRDGALHIGMIARLAPGKRHDLLLDAVERLDRTGDAVRVTIVGDGPRRTEVDAALARVRDARRVARVRDVPKFLGDLDALVLLSDHEGAPRTILEGMAAGLPIVASDVGGIPELTGAAGSALLVPNCVDAVASALRSLFDPALRRELGARAREHALAEHAFERCSAAYDAHYRTFS